jgi:hypothetical protein
MRLVCIPAIKGHIKYVDYSLKLLLKRFPDEDFIIVTPHQNSFNYLNNEQITVRSDADFLDLTPEEIKSKLTDDKKSMYKWYYQQFLKYSIVSKSKQYTEVLIVDADTIILSNCAQDNDSLNLTTLEYNKSYFHIIREYFPRQKLLPKSAIVNFMWFNTALFSGMLDSIVGKSKIKWFQIILESINKAEPLFAFSEYETYANYKFNNKKTTLKTLRIFRRADLFMDFYSFEKIIKVANIYKLDLLSFEDGHNKSFLKKVIVFLMIAVIELRLFLINILNIKK